MTQARSGQALRLRLTPMQPPEAVSSIEVTQDAAVLAGVASASTPSSCKLLVHPGEAGEILVHLENLSSRTLQVNLQVSGDFPATWCQIGMEGYELIPGQQMEAVLYFQVPMGFFEDAAALALNEPVIFDYRSWLYVYYTERTADSEPGLVPQTTAVSGSFDLYVRPRSLYLDFLPAFYRESDFTGRLLKIFEQAFEPAVQSLDVLWAYIDPLTAPRELLPFLSHWVDWRMDERLGVDRQRRLIRHAVELYRWHGTRRGLCLYLHLYTDLPLDEHLTLEAEKHISIEEFSGNGFVLSDTRLGQDARVGGGRPYHFIVRLRPDAGETIDESLVRHVIDREKPAFCTYDLYIEPRA